MKIIRLKVTIIAISSEKIANIYRDNIWRIHRVPKKIFSNKNVVATTNQDGKWHTKVIYR